MTGIFVGSQWIFIPPLPPPSWNYATDLLVLKFNDAGDPLWTLPIRMANSTTMPVVSYDCVEIVECRAGGYAVASPFLKINNDGTSWGIMLSRISDAGRVVWKHTFDNISLDKGLSLIETQSEGFALAGTHCFLDPEVDAWNRDIFLWHFNNEGQVIWAKTYDESLGDWGYSLVECSSGGYAIGGTTEMRDDMKRDTFIIRTDENGTLLWRKAIGGLVHEDGRCIAECSDAGYIVVGSIEDSDKSSKAFIVRTNASGNSIWNCTYGDGEDATALSLCELGQDRFAITGYSRHSSASAIDTLFLLIESDGVITQSKTLHYQSRYRPYHHYLDCEGHDIVQTCDGNLMIIGTVNRGPRADDWEIMLMRIDTHGTLLLNSTHGTNSWETGCSIVVCGDGGYAISGVRIGPRE
jgi:hypothetical protein